MANYDVPIDIKINIVEPEVLQLDTPPGILPATRDALASLFNTQLDFFGLALPAYVVILAALCLLAFVVSLNGWAAGSPYRERGRSLTNTIPLVLLLGMSFVLPNLHSADAEDIDHAGLTVTTNPTNIVWNVPQGTATSETFTGTTTVFSDANNGYELFATGDITGINSPTHDIGFSIVSGGDLAAITPLNDTPVLIKSHNLPIADDVSTFDFRVDIPRTLAIGEYTVSLNFRVEAPDFPAMENISPLVGPEAGGTDITITGVNLTDVNDVAFVEVGGLPCDVVNVTVPQPNGDPDLVSPSPTFVVCKTRAHAAGPVDLKITNPDSGIVDVPKQFYYLAAPTVTSITPLRIYSGQGARLTITGTNFDMVSAAPGNKVELQPQAPFTPSTPIDCTIHDMSDTRIECDVPTMLATSYTASVVTAGGTGVSSGVNGILTVQNAPGVTSLSPASGALAGTNSITVNGNNFTTDGTTSVTIGGKDCTGLSVTSSSQLTCTVPAGDGPAPATVDVRVTVAFAAVGGGNVTSTNNDVDNYTYLNGPSIDPSPGGGSDVSIDAPTNPNVPSDMHGSRPPVVDLGGNYYGQPARLTINGSGFDTSTNTTAITVGSKPCTILTSTTTTLTCNPPTQTTVGNYPVVVSTSAGSYPASPQVINLYYLDKPTITKLSPNPVPASAASTITIEGTNFDNISNASSANKVMIGAGECTNLNIISSSLLTCFTPSNLAAGGKQSISIETLAGIYEANGNSGRNDVEVVFQDAPAISLVSPNTGPTAGGTEVTVTASDICLNNVSLINGAAVTKGGTATSVFNAAVTTSVACTSSTGTSGGTFKILMPNVTSSGAGQADISVSTTVGNSTNTAADNFAYMNTPVITSFAPLAADVAGKAQYTDWTSGTLTINGSNFDNIGANTITINNVLCPSAGTDTSTQLQCTIPASTISTNGGAGTDLEVKVITHGDTATKGGTGNLDGFSYLGAPTVTGISPARGQSSVSREVTIAGSNFDNITGNRSTTTSTAVKIGSGDCVNVKVNSTGSLTCNTPAMAAGGPLDIVVTTLAGTFTLAGGSGGFTFQDAPNNTGISPIAGNKAGGYPLTISGTNLSSFDPDPPSSDIVTIGGVPCTNARYESSTNTIDCTVPAMPSGETVGARTVAINTLAGNHSLVGAFTYLDNPTLVSISRFAGPIGGNTRLAITGTNFDDFNDPTSTRIFFGSDEYTMIYAALTPVAGECRVISDELANCVTLPHAPSAPLSVTSSTAGVNATSTLTYQYLNTPGFLQVTPRFGPITGGTSITITGETGIRPTDTPADATVTVGGNPCNITSVSYTSVADTTITCTTTVSAVSGWAVVETTTDGGTHPETDTFYYLAAPTINNTTISSPNYGVANTQVTITGTNFDPDFDATPKGTGTSIFMFDGEEAYCAVSTATVAICTVPNHPGGATYADGTPHPIDITLVTGYYTDNPPDPTAWAKATATFDYMPQPSISSADPSTGPLIVANKQLTIYGTGFDRDIASGMGYGSTSVTVGGRACNISAINSTGSSLTCTVDANASAFSSSTIVAVAVTTAGGTARQNVYTVYSEPTVSSVTNNYGVIGTPAASDIVIAGSNFVSGLTTVKFGALSANCAYNSTSQLTCTSPAIIVLPPVTNTVDVIVTTPGGSSAVHDTNTKFDYMAAPTISRVENNNTNNIYGPSTQHTVKITGTNFRSATSSTDLISSVTLGGQPCNSISIASDTSLTCTTTADLAASTRTNDKNAVVTSRAGQTSGSTGNGQYTIYGLPVISSINASSGPFTNAPSVTIQGSGFRDVTSITFGAAGACGNVIATVNNYTILTCTPPDYSTAGKVDVTITAVGGTSTVQTGTNDDYTYVVQPTLIAGGITPSPTTTASKTVVLDGTNFLAGDTKVQVQGTDNSITATVTSTTRLNFAMPEKAVTTATNFTVRVTTPGGTSNAINYEVLPVPTITNVSPSNGSRLGNTEVTVSGTNFCRADGSTSAITAVQVGTINGTLVAGSINCSATPNTIRFKTPAKPDGDIYDYAITVTTAGGTSITSTNDIFRYVLPPVVTSVKQSVGGATAAYVKSGDVVYVYADYLCEASSPLALSSAAVTASADAGNTRPIATYGTPVCSNATSGYVSVTLPNAATSMTAMYDIILTNANGTSTPAAADQVIYPPAPTISAFDNATFSEYVSAAAGATGVILTGTNFKTAATGTNLVKAITIYDANGVSNPASVTGYSVSTTVATSITGVTIPVLSEGNHVIKVETYGGTGSFTFHALGAVAISSPTSSNPAYLWSTAAINAAIVADESFNISGSNLVSRFTTITIEDVAPATYVSNGNILSTCTFVSVSSITGCKIDRTNTATNANAAVRYTLKAVSALVGTAERTDSIWIDQIAPTVYNFAGTAPVFACSNLVTRPNATASTYHTAFVKDTRDNTTYRVRKLLDGNCWMIDNLSLSALTLTSALSDVVTAWGLPAVNNASGNQGGMPDSAQVRSNAGGALVYHQQNRGLFYNGRAAHAGQAAATNDVSVCPAGWRLPNSAEYPALGAAYNNVYANIWAQATGEFSTTFPGYYAGSGLFSGGGELGRYINNQGGLYGWMIRSNGTAAAFGGGNQGQASTVRCVKR